MLGVSRSRVTSSPYRKEGSLFSIFGIETAFHGFEASTFFLTRMSNVHYEIQLMREIQLKHLFLLPAHRDELWFLAFVALLTFSVQFASPFFTPYMLMDLHFDLVALGIVTATSVLAKILSYPYWGKIIDRFGNRAVLIVIAFASPLGSVLWLFSKDLPMLVLFNLVSGFIWSGYEIAVFNYALSLVGRELRTSFISKYNVFVNVFYAGGAIAGGLFLMEFSQVALFGFSGILLVFLISAVMRLVVAIAFTPKLAGGREVMNTSQERAMIFDIVAVYPMQGAVSNVLGGWNFTRKAVGNTASQSRVMLKEGLGATGELLKEGGRKFMSKVSRRKHL